MLNATLEKRIQITPELLRLVVKPDQPFKPFKAGQYVVLGLPGSAPRPADFPAEEQLPNPDKLIKRAYSIGSAPENGESIEFYIAVVPTGILTSRLVVLKEGDRLYIAPKITGTFTLDDVPAQNNSVLVSTGTGLAPYISMLLSPSTWTDSRAITIVHGVRYPQDLAYRDEIQALQIKRNNLFYYQVVSRADQSWNGHKGHVQSLFKDGVIQLNPGKDNVFLCGNPAMIDQMEEMLLQQGYTVHSKKNPGNLHLEKYW